MSPKPATGMAVESRGFHSDLSLPKADKGFCHQGDIAIIGEARPNPEWVSRACLIWPRDACWWFRAHLFGKGLSCHLGSSATHIRSPPQPPRGWASQEWRMAPQWTPEPDYPGFRSCFCHLVAGKLRTVLRSSSLSVPICKMEHLVPQPLLRITRVN